MISGLLSTFIYLIFAFAYYNYFTFLNSFNLSILTNSLSKTNARKTSIVD